MEERYKRQILLPEVGREGQQKLKKAGVLIIGAGGLASSAAYYLAAAGIGKIGLADNDTVDESNLNRQILHTTARIGMAKALSAQKSLEQLNPDIEIIPYLHRLESPDELSAVLDAYDLMVDCSDNYATRYSINEASHRTGKPWIYGAVLGFEGQVMTILPGKGACYRCLYPAAPSHTDPVVPVIGTTPGLIGIIQATEALKYFLETGRPLVGKLFFIDLLEMSVSEFNVPKNPDCPICGNVA